MNCPLCKSRVTTYIECDFCHECGTLMWDNELEKSLWYLFKKKLNNVEFEFMVYVEKNLTNIRFAKPKSKWEQLCNLNYIVDHDNVDKTIEKLKKLVIFT